MPCVSRQEAAGQQLHKDAHMHSAPLRQDGPLQHNSHSGCLLGRHVGGIDAAGKELVQGKAVREGSQVVFCSSHTGNVYGADSGVYDYARTRAAPSVKHAVYAAFVLAFVSFGGLFLQAACPLQADLIEQIANLTDAHSARVMRDSLTLQTWLHQFGAISFFIGSVLHGFCILYVYG